MATSASQVFCAARVPERRRRGIPRYSLLQVIFVFAASLGALTFAPTAARAQCPNPVPVAIGCLIWTIALALVAPLTVRAFQIVTTLAITAIAAISLYLWSVHFPGTFEALPVWFWTIIVVFLDFGWLMVSTPLWRWARGIVVTQQTAEHHSN